jgi:multiple sugar transport system permease protein
MVKLKIYHIFVLIAIAYILATSIFPMIYMVFGSFTDWNLSVSQMNFIGTKNYADLVSDYRFYNSLTVTALITIIAVPSEVLLGLLLAQLMALKLRFRRLFRTIFLFPVFCSPVAVAMMGNILFYENGGPINGVIKLLGFGSFPWRSNTTIAPFTVVLCDIWMWTPFCFLIILAGIESVPREFIEAAVVDGASLWHIFRRINIPLLGSALTTVLMFRIIDGLKIFEIPMILMGGGGPGIVTESLTIYIYKKAFRMYYLGQAAAISLIFLLIISFVALIFVKRVRKYYV